MRRPTPPMCTPAASGSVVVWEADHRAGLVDVADGGSVHRLPGDDVVLTAASPSGDRIAVGTSTSVIVYGREHDWDRFTEYDLGVSLFRLTVADDGTAAGVTAHDDGDPSTVFLMSDGRITTRSLGEHVTAFTVLLDAERGRLLLAGQRGRGSFHGGGEPFVQLFEFAGQDDSWRHLWDGPAPVAEPNGWVMPLAFGDIGVHDLDRLVVVSPDTNPDDVGTPVDELDLGHLETVVRSPDGLLVAWLWRDEDDDIVHLRSARLADGTVTDHPDLDELDAGPSLAVDDDGAVTVIDVVRPATVRIRRLLDGEIDESTWSVVER